jgi:serine phosphatase RsbU (regulator of sigma subunit)
MLPLPGGKIALFIADVSGKSVRAQARLPLLKYALRALSPLYPEPAVLLRRLNENLAPDLQPELFIALCCIVLDPAHNTLSWCNAGHIAPLLLPQPGCEENVEDGVSCPIMLPLETDGPALGMFGDTVYETRTLPWQPGDQILMFTDGLVDALSYGDSEDGEAQIKRLCSRLITQRRLGAREEAQNFVDMAVAAFDATTPLTQRINIHGSNAPSASSTHRDDVTVALIRFRD